MIASSFLSSKLLSSFHFNFNTTDYFCASVIHLIRKYYIHISWKEGGRRVWVMVPSIAALPPIPILQWGKSRESKSSATSSQYFTLPQHHSKVEGGKYVCVSRGYPQSPERGGERPKEKRRCSVLDPAGRGLLVEGDELGLCAARHSLRRLLLCLLLLLRATRGSNLLVHGLLAWHVRLLGGHIGVLSWQC